MIDSDKCLMYPNHRRSFHYKQRYGGMGMLVSQLQNEVSIVLRDVWGRDVFFCDRFQNLSPFQEGSGVTYRQCKFRVEDQIFEPGIKGDSRSSAFFGHTCVIQRYELYQFAEQCRQWLKQYSPASKYPHLSDGQWYLAVLGVSSDESGYVEVITQYKPHWWSRKKETRYTIERNRFSEWIIDLLSEVLL